MTTNLSPVVCKNEAEAGDAVYDGVRRRPVVAINEKGQLVVCCRRTAKKNGWQVQAAAYQRGPVATPAKKTVKVPQRRSTDGNKVVVLPAAKVARVKKTVAELLK